MQKLLLILTCLAIVSCKHDYDDLIENKNSITDIEYISQEGVTYYTGSLGCAANGSYFYKSDKVLEDLVVPTNLPDNIDLSVFLPPVGDQGKQGSCISWATTYYLKSFQERIQSGLLYDESRIMSPAYTYNQIVQGACGGTIFESTLDVLKSKGAASLQSFPYSDLNCFTQPSLIQNEEAAFNKISDYKYLSGQNMVLEMKTLLTQETPILISVFLTKKFGETDDLGLTSYREHVVDFTDGGCHGMLVVGYSDTKNAFKVVNSWGENWGNNGGFVWIDYAAFHNVADNTASFRVISTAIIAYDL